MITTDELFGIFKARGREQYFGEDVSQLEHALQAAFFAQEAHCSDSLITAALLHDIGHLLHHEGEDIADHGIDSHHEQLGETWLAEHFSQAVTEPVRLHVAAKRYLCATQPEYFQKLSPASVHSLALQGGPMSPDEVTAFEANPFYGDAVRLRGFDDRAKAVGMEAPGLEHYRELLSRQSTSTNRTA